MHDRELRSFDGTRIAYRVGGEGERWLVVCNGYGGTYSSWTEMFQLLERRYRLLIWDYRGLHRSQVPERRESLRVQDHCRDLDALMAAEGCERVILLGWSVGVQVALERYHISPRGVEALILINGAHGRVLHRSMDGRLAALALPPLVSLAESGSFLITPVAQPVLRALTRSSLALKAAHALGIVNGELPSFHQAMQELFALRFDVYFQMIRFADQHDAEGILPGVRVPVLVTAGDRDIITPPRVARRTASLIPGATYFEIPGGTHYSPMEYPRLLANRIDSFVSGQG